MDVRYTATAKAETTETYDCAKCGYAGNGSVAVIGVGVARRGGLLFGNDRAGEMAGDAAEANAWTEAMSHVALAACPQCGARDRGAWTKWLASPTRWLQPLAVGGGAGFVIPILVLAMFHVQPGGAVWVVSTVAAIAGFAGALAVVARIKANQTKRVVFTPRTP